EAIVHHEDLGHRLALLVDRRRADEQQPVDGLVDRPREPVRLPRRRRQETEASSPVGMAGGEERTERFLADGVAIFSVHDTALLEEDQTAALRQRQDEPAALAAGSDRL